MDQRPIGYLMRTATGHNVMCPDCVRRSLIPRPGRIAPDSVVNAAVAKEMEAQCPIFHINIYPYNQNCAKCETLLVEGASASWPQLFDAKA